MKWKSYIIITLLVIIWSHRAKVAWDLFETDYKLSIFIWLPIYLILIISWLYYFWLVRLQFTSLIGPTNNHLDKQLVSVSLYQKQISLEISKSVVYQKDINRSHTVKITREPLAPLHISINPPYSPDFPQANFIWFWIAGFEKKRNWLKSILAAKLKTFIKSIIFRLASRLEKVIPAENKLY